MGDPGFDWDEELEPANATPKAETAPPSSGAYVPRKASAAPEPSPDASRGEGYEGMIRAALDTATFGQAPNIVGTLEALPALVTPGRDFPQEVLSRSGEYRREYDAAKEKHPVTSLAGGLLQPIPGPAKAVAAAKLARLALSGAVSAGLETVGDELNKPTESLPPEKTWKLWPGTDLPPSASRVVDSSLVGAGAGVVGGKAADWLSSRIGGLLERFGAKAPPALRNYAKEKALSAVGVGKKDVKGMMKHSTEDRTSDFLLDTPGVMNLGDTAVDIHKQVVPVTKKAGEDIGAVWSGADDVPHSAGVDMLKVFGDVRKKLVDPLKKNMAATKDIAFYDNKLAEMGFVAGDVHGGIAPFKDAHETLVRLGKDVRDWKKENRDNQELLENLYLAIRDSLEKELKTTGGEISGRTGRPLMSAEGRRLASKLAEAKHRFGTATDVEGMAADAAASMKASRLRGLAKDVGALVGGASTGYGVGGVPVAVLGATAGVASNLARERGASTLAVGANKLSKALPKIMEKVQGSPYEQLLQKAAITGGEDAALALHQALVNRHPAYRALIGGPDG